MEEMEKEKERNDDVRQYEYAQYYHLSFPSFSFTYAKFLDVIFPPTFPQSSLLLLLGTVQIMMVMMVVIMMMVMMMMNVVMEMVKDLGEEIRQTKILIVLCSAQYCHPYLCHSH